MDILFIDQHLARILSLRTPDNKAGTGAGTYLRLTGNFYHPRNDGH